MPPQLGKVYSTLTSSLLVLWWIYPIGEGHLRLMQPCLIGSVQLPCALRRVHDLRTLEATHQMPCILKG